MANRHTHMDTDIYTYAIVISSATTALYLKTDSQVVFLQYQYQFSNRVNDFVLITGTFMLENPGFD